MFKHKPGKSSYTGPRNFRPHILTSFLLKTMERLVDRYFRDGAVAMVPLHPNQHACQAGKSVETALHQLVFRVEKAFDQRERALGVFLHREAAFNTTFGSMCDALIRHGVGHTTVRWIRANLEGRAILHDFFSGGLPCPGDAHTRACCRHSCSASLLII